MTRDLPPLDLALAGLMRVGKAVPYQSDDVRARAMIRARAAVATGERLATLDVPPPPARMVRIVLAACLAFAIGAAGATVALHGHRRDLKIYAR